VNPEDRAPGSRRGRMLAESAVVEEMPVWLEVNGAPAVTWMCTPDQLEELATDGSTARVTSVARRPGEAAALRFGLGSGPR